MVKYQAYELAEYRYMGSFRFGIGTAIYVSVSGGRYHSPL